MLSFSRIVYTGLFLLLFLNCKNSSSVIEPTDNQQGSLFDLQAHRGGAGLYPQNTINAFINAIDLGVSTLEMDVCITKDRQVIVTHDLILSPSFVTKPDGTPLTISDPRVIIFQQPYSILKQYDVGLRRDPSYPNSKLGAAEMPLLSDVLERCETYAASKGRKISYSIELKIGTKGWDMPKTIAEYWTLVENDLEAVSNDKVIIQCFDASSLNYIYKTRKRPFRLAFLTSGANIQEQLDKLDFIPDIYSPSYKMIDGIGISYCHSKNIMVVPYVLNDNAVVDIFKNEYKVDGIITDYPNRFVRGN